MEAAQELEALRLQEREIGRKTEKLKNQVEKVQGKLDMLIEELENSHSAVERLTATKKDLIATQEQIEYYESETATLNQSLIQLKRSYDALDIEYAQLYERQNAAR
jgi:predicted nuclease with TOPRIM domain